MKSRRLYLVATMALGLAACDEVLEIDPPTDAISVEETYSTQEGICAAITGLYSRNYLSTQVFYQTMDIYLSMFSDELIYYRTSSAEYYASDWTDYTTIFNTLWTSCYNTVFRSNDVIANLTGSTVLSEAETNSGLAAAYYFRALGHFWLVSMFGDCPLALSNVYTETQNLPRESADKVYEQVIEDLKMAQELMGDYENPKTRVTQDAITHLLSRVYLYSERWQEAKEEANKILPSADGGSGGSKYQLETLERVFLSGSKEAVAQLNLEGWLHALLSVVPSLQPLHALLHERRVHGGPEVRHDGQAADGVAWRVQVLGRLGAVLSLQV